MTSAKPWTLSGRFAFPIDSPPVPNALITIEAGRLVSIESAKGRAADISLGNVAILPGFVNAHTHLDLEFLPPPSGDAPEDQVAWLRRVIAERRHATDESTRATIEANLAACIAAGTTTLADISSASASWNPLIASPLRVTVFAELIGLRPDRAASVHDHAMAWLAQAKSSANPNIRPGLSPHAPYSTAPWLYERAAYASVPLTTHLAELPEELELLANRSGPLRAFLEDIGAWTDDWQPAGPNPSSYLALESMRDADCLIAHGTYFGTEDLPLLRRGQDPRAPRKAVAFCPRTTALFGHGPHPYREMLAAGVSVCLGTDSLASAPSLSILDEMRFLARGDESTPHALLLAMATIQGAWALRLDTQIGSLAPGKDADLAIVALPDRDDPDPHRLVIDSDLPVIATICRGRFIHGPWTSPE